VTRHINFEALKRVRTRSVSAEGIISCGQRNVLPLESPDTDAWKKLNKEERMFLTGGKYDLATGKWLTPSAPNQTHFLPFQSCVIYPAMACKEHLTVHYSFDLNKQFKNHASDLFKLMKADENIRSRYRFGRVRIEHNKAVKISLMPPILQAAIKNAREPEDFPFFDEAGLNVALHNLPTDMRSEGWYPVKLKDPKLRRKRV
jgi:hypothetical protein